MGIVHALSGMHNCDSCCLGANYLNRLELTVWFVPSLIQNAIAVSLVGLFLGPMFPIAMKQTGKIVPRVLLSGAIGWISSIGQVGSAVLPFLTGALASRFGISSLQPL
jgi:fucose permease